MTDLPPIRPTLRGAVEIELQAQPVRLFVSFAYVSATQTTCGLKPAVFGNTILDIEFEPSEPEHVAGLQRDIGAHMGISGVIVQHWQRVGPR